MPILTAVFWLMALAAVVLPVPVAIYLFLGTTAFGSLALIPPDAANGVNILPQSLAAVILAGKVFSTPRLRAIILKAAKDIRGYGLECAFVGFAVIAALALPRIFEGHVYTVTLRMTLEAAEPLEPTVSNLAQAAYLILNLAAGLSLFAYILDDDQGRRREQVLAAILVGGGILAFSGILDSASAYITPLKDVVMMFKTAKYQYFSEGSIVHVRRIVGFFPEASSFGAAAVATGGLLYFARPAFRSKVARTLLCPIISFTLIALAALSTSSTAYVGLGVFGVVVVGRLIYQIYKAGTISGLELDLTVAVILAILFVAILVFAPEFTKTPLALIDSMVFHKTQSASYTQRSQWNSTAMQAFYGTFGLGVGTGGARTSNWLVSLLSNTGLVGFVLMAAFIGVSYLHRPKPGAQRSDLLMSGAKYSFVVFLATQVASGTTIDPGFMLAINMALMIASSERSMAYLPSRSSSRKSRKSRRGSSRRETITGVRVDAKSKPVVD